MYWAILLLCNVPIYLFLGGIVFDTKQDAAQSFLDTIIAILKIIFIPRIVRVFMGMDDSAAYSAFHVVMFLGACALLTGTEHVLLQKYVFA
jgi:hypothetical protein